MVRRHLPPGWWHSENLKLLPSIRLSVGPVTGGITSKATGLQSEHTRRKIGCGKNFPISRKDLPLLEFKGVRTQPFSSQFWTGTTAASWCLGCHSGLTFRWNEKVCLESLCMQWWWCYKTWQWTDQRSTSSIWHSSWGSWSVVRKQVKPPTLLDYFFLSGCFASLLVWTSLAEFV